MIETVETICYISVIRLMHRSLMGGLIGFGMHGCNIVILHEAGEGR